MNEFNLNLAEARNRLACGLGSRLLHHEGEVYNKISNEAVQHTTNGFISPFAGFYVQFNPGWRIE